MKNNVIWLLLMASLNCFAQKDSLQDYRNEINLELLGSGIIYSVNYERIFYQKRNVEYKGSIGIYFNPIRIKDVFDYRTIGFNIELKINYFIERNSIEIGLGYTYIYLFDIIDHEEIFGCCSDLKLLIPRLGYRRYNKSKLKYWGLSFTPIFTLDLNEEGDEWDSNFFIPYGGIRYGWKF